MLSRDPTFLGKIAAVSGSAITVHLSQSVASGLSFINGQIYKIGQVGSFVRVPQGYQDLLVLYRKLARTRCRIERHLSMILDGG